MHYYTPVVLSYIRTDYNDYLYSNFNIRLTNLPFEQPGDEIDT